MNNSGNQRDHFIEAQNNSTDVTPQILVSYENTGHSQENAPNNNQEESSFETEEKIENFAHIVINSNGSGDSIEKAAINIPGFGVQGRGPAENSFPLFRSYNTEPQRRPYDRSLQDRTRRTRTYAEDSDDEEDEEESDKESENEMETSTETTEPMNVDGSAPEAGTTGNAASEPTAADVTTVQDTELRLSFIAALFAFFKTQLQHLMWWRTQEMAIQENNNGQASTVQQTSTSEPIAEENAPSSNEGGNVNEQGDGPSPGRQERMAARKERRNSKSSPYGRPKGGKK